MSDLVQWDFDHLFLPQNITLVHNTDDIMLIGPSEQEAVATLDLLVTICASEDGNKSLKIQSTSVKFLGVHGCETCIDTPPKVKDKALHPTPSHHQESSTTFSGPRSGRQHTLHLGVLLQPIYQVTRKRSALRGTCNGRGLSTGPVS